MGQFRYIVYQNEFHEIKQEEIVIKKVKMAFDELQDALDYIEKQDNPGDYEIIQA